MDSERNNEVIISKIGENDAEILLEKIDLLSDIVRLSGQKREVVVTDIKMSFKSMITFMVKWVIASIPAVIILMVLGAIMAGALSGLVGGFK